MQISINLGHILLLVIIRSDDHKYNKTGMS